MRLPSATDLKVWHLLVLLVVAVACAVLVAMAARCLGLSRGLRLGLTVAAFLAVVFLPIRGHRINLVDGLGLMLALIGLAGALVAGLIFLGPIEPSPGVGCINTDGANQATVSAENTSIYPEANQASTPTGLLLEGCIVHYDTYCIGAVQTDAQFSEVRDSRWLRLGDDELIAAAHTVGVVPRDQQPSSCPGGKEKPSLEFRRAIYSPKSRLIELDARAPRAAVIGFALKREDGRWLRIGWDQSPGSGAGAVFRAPAIASAGKVVFATPCMAFERPIGPTQELNLTTGPVRGEATHYLQPTHRQAAAAACDAGVPEE